TPKMDVHAVDMPLEEFLDEILGGNNRSYVVKDKTIAVRRANRASRITSPKPTRQQREITGKVTDEEGNVLSGVTVRVKGGQAATTTNDDGIYRLTIDESEATLVFSLLGYEADERLVSSEAQINVMLKAAISDLEEVVV